ncbi:hypothetical protein AVEN_205611-1 [Araneus ventricosus]|uniref:Uncharacterized protein n=1 Tax=Araneus ventricosus TaxID=182803 RepID=A0A4Y2QVL0_ARAVE|nr:hypothetical protein AVEN_205611-1 [Araneus ventricosus]
MHENDPLWMKGLRKMPVGTELISWDGKDCDGSESSLSSASSSFSISSVISDRISSSVTPAKTIRSSSAVKYSSTCSGYNQLPSPFYGRWRYWSHLFPMMPLCHSSLCACLVMLFSVLSCVL